MSPRPTHSTVRPWAWLALGLALLPVLAPWPVAQGILHGFLIAALLPLVPDPLMAGLLALAAGWLTEGTLGMVPHLGGVAWGDLSLILLVRMADRFRPPDSRWIYTSRVVGILILQGLLIHAAVFLANGPHAWGTVWLWPPLTALLWGPRLWAYHQIHRRR